MGLTALFDRESGVVEKAEASLEQVDLEKLKLNNDFESLRWFLLPSEAHAQACGGVEI